MHDYVEQVKKFCSSVCRDIDIAIFTGWSKGYYQSICACHRLPVYVQPQDYYSGDPSCKVSHRVLAPSEVKYEWIPPKKSASWATEKCPWPMEGDMDVANE